MRFSFDTDRLHVISWHQVPVSNFDVDQQVRFIQTLLVDEVKAELPPSWQGPYDAARAKAWIEDRKNEGHVLLLLHDKEPLGLLLLGETEHDHRPELRVGYLLVRSQWGKGYASELISGLLCRLRDDEHSTIRSVAGGVSSTNASSARVLEKNGFHPVVSAADAEARPVNETMWRWIRGISDA